MPSEGILEASNIFDEVESLYNNQEIVYVKYIADIDLILPSTSLTSMPVTGETTENAFIDSNSQSILNSNQPIFYNFDTDGNQIDINRFGPTKLSCIISGSDKPGKLKIAGQTLYRLDTDLIYGINFDGLNVRIDSEIKTLLGISGALPLSIGIARIDLLRDEDDNNFDIIGTTILKNSYSIGNEIQDTSFKGYSFRLPSTSVNNSVNLTPGAKVTISALIYNTNDYEELYYSADNTVITNKTFARIDRVSVSSGFRSAAGVLVGNLRINQTNQPNSGSTYVSGYKFKSPKEGERITVRYNTNKLVSDATIAIENVRPVTADVLVKESPAISIDVIGQILINDDALSNTNSIIENVTNAVVNLLNTSKLGSIIDYSDIISIAAGVVGVDSINISLFNETGRLGRKTFIKSLDNQTIIAGAVTFTAIKRKDFRIT